LVTANGLFKMLFCFHCPRTDCSKVLFCLHFYFNAMRPRTSSGHLILVFRCHPQAKCGGEESKEEGWEAFNPDAELQPEGEEEDMHVFQSNAGARGKGRGWGSPGGRATSARWSLPGPPAWWCSTTGCLRCMRRQGGRGGLRAPAINDSPPLPLPYSSVPLRMRPR